MKYLIESPHTKEECLKELDGLAAKGDEVLNKFTWGCMAGEHTGFALIEAESERAAREVVPEVVRNKARIHRVASFTRTDVEKFHTA